MSRSMTQSIRALIVTVAALAGLLSPAVSRAQALAPLPEEVRTGFERAGFAVSPATNWWTGNVTTFTASDQRDVTQRGTVVMVLVYDDAQSAHAAQQRAEANGGILVPGYGEVAWIGTVAIVQSTVHELNRGAQDELNRELFASADSPVVTPPHFAVDGEFTALLHQTVGPIDL
jgi:hypothetical protein